MRNARAHKIQWSDPTVHSSTVNEMLNHVNGNERIPNDIS